MSRQGLRSGHAERIERIGFYIDGFNFYHGLRAKGWARYRWLDYRALIDRFVRDGQRVELAKYFTTRVTDVESRQRQDRYLQALGVRGGLDLIEGKFEMRSKQCGECGKWFKRPQEKYTDVNIATHLLLDALDDQVDTVAVITADSDLLPALTAVTARFARRFVLIDPPRRHSDELAKLADAHLHVPENWLRQCQLPDPVEYLNRKSKVRHVYKPDGWR
ncbi:NYN domain-containing protein [Acidimicrobiaceae bacterium USS-CC1]|uniref:NYN domain-containing protein n=1 Tax=Acidiferrimicrobium australe TaxID=2664430 RepID=A0ABW9QQE6_9ACTN|nr:NYN domain-containing protein [Acidiferrimicrobium australe]